MSEAQPLEFDVEYVIDIRASQDEVEAVAKIALEEGVPGEVKAALSQKSIDEMPWQVLILAPVAPFLKGFLEEAGRNSYKDLRRFVSRLISAGRREKGPVQIMERNSLTTVVFPPDIPEEAFAQLANLDLENIEGKYWVWDREQQCWIYQSMGGE